MGDAPTSRETIFENKPANISKHEVINENKIAKIPTFAKPRNLRPSKICMYMVDHV